MPYVPDSALDWPTYPAYVGAPKYRSVRRAPGPIELGSMSREAQNGGTKFKVDDRCWGRSAIRVIAQH
jgi:hypothetical protein